MQFMRCVRTSGLSRAKERLNSPCSIQVPVKNAKKADLHLYSSSVIFEEVSNGG